MFLASETASQNRILNNNYQYFTNVVKFSHKGTMQPKKEKITFPIGFICLRSFMLS
jgi:hypothetical protein